MDRENRIRELMEIKNAIKEKETSISKNQSELDALREDLKIAQETVLPILLFTIDKSSPLAKKREVLYVYYCPDFDSIRYASTFVSNGLEEGFMPGTLDFRKFFKDLNMPEYQWPTYCDNFDNITHEALLRITKIIDNAFSINDFESWKDVSEYLEDIYLKQEERELEDRIDLIIDGLSEKEKMILRKMTR